jgi:hypothetical protein
MATVTSLSDAASMPKLRLEWSRWPEDVGTSIDTPA